MSDGRKAVTVLAMNTLAFTVCFAVWMMNGVLITFFVSQGLYEFTSLQVGVLMATPVLTGSIFRLPVGILTDRFGGRIVYFVLMLLSALALLYYSIADGFTEFLLSALGFGLAGASFAVGIAYTSVWFSSKRQGTALGIFGAGNAGAAVTLLAAPQLLSLLTSGNTNPEGWRKLPLIYAGALFLMALLFWFFTHYKVAEHARSKTMRQRLAPLGSMRVWRFGAYYFLVFGAFVALSQWLVPYYVKFYELSLATAGVFAAAFSLPSGVIRAAGGWLSDHFGARRVMYWVLGSCTLGCTLLFFPRMEITSPGEGVIAASAGEILSINENAMVVKAPKTGKETIYTIDPGGILARRTLEEGSEDLLVLPKSVTWQQWAHKVVTTENGEESRRPFVIGDKVEKRELLASGRTHIFFQANVWIFTFIVFVIGIAMGIGKAAVYKHIPDYFPEDVGVVGGLVGVIGGLGGFFCPIIFGQLLDMTGIWTSCWVFLALFSLLCLVWMHRVVERMLKEKAPGAFTELEVR